MKALSFEEEIEELLASLDEDYASIAEKNAKEEEALYALEQKRVSLRCAIDVYREMRGLPKREPNVDEVFRERFANKTVKEVLLAIAQERNGMLIGTEVVPIMVRAGIVRDTKAGTARFYNAVARYSHLFEWIGRGKYRLIG